MGHKSAMGVPFRFHLAMADPEFRSFIKGRTYRNGFAAVW